MDDRAVRDNSHARTRLKNYLKKKMQTRSAKDSRRAT